MTAYGALNGCFFPETRVNLVEDPGVDEAARYVLAPRIWPPLDQKHSKTSLSQHVGRSKPSPTCTDDYDFKSLHGSYTFHA